MGLGLNSYDFYEISALKGVTKIFTTQYYTYAWTKEAEVYMFGIGQCVYDSMDSRPRFISKVELTTEQEKYRREKLAEFKQSLEIQNISNSNYMMVNNLLTFVENYIPPIRLGAIEELHGIFSIHDLVFIWHHDCIEIMNGYHNTNFTNRHQVYQSKDILYVTSNTGWILVVLDNNDIVRLRPLRKNFMQYDTEYVFHVEKVAQNIQGFYLGSEFLLLLYDVESIPGHGSEKPWQYIELYQETLSTNSNRVTESMATFFKQAIDCLMTNISPKNSMDTIWPQIYDDKPRVKICGAGEIISGCLKVRYGRILSKNYQTTNNIKFMDFGTPSNHSPTKISKI